MMKRIVVGAGIAAIGLATYAGIRQVRATWGVDPEEARKPLPGDDLVEAPLSTDTRGITIEAPPELVWPWLVQMGFGRGGWYSVDQLDMRGPSANRIVDDWQGLAVGDIMPTHPGGGFEVRAIEPGRALVLYGDTATMQPLDAAGSTDVTAGLAASGAFLSATPRDFAATWSFVLEPLGPRRTRLIERVRYWGADGGAVSNAALSLLGLGVFVMMQRQMVGIRTRAERLALEQLPVPAVPTDHASNGKAAELPDTVIAVAGRA
jgi:hypothetical protein